VGRAEALTSWRAILGNDTALRITRHAEHAVQHGDWTIVTCIEKIAGEKDDPEYLPATNVFERVGQI
jgi:hypothetical protein